MRRAELFPADRGLQSRMVAAAVLTPLSVVVMVLVLALLLPGKVLLGLAAGVVAGVVVAVRAHRADDRAKVLEPGQVAWLQDGVDRLCVAADVPRPEIVLVRDDVPNSWVVDLPARPPRLHVTSGLLDLLEPDELDAVLAHELAHVAHRDATVMSVVGLPGTVLLEGGRRVQHVGVLWVSLGMLLGAVIGGVSQIGTNALSRHRETSADAAAARITGKPWALASALRKVSGEIARIPHDDLRAVGHAAFNLVPVEVESDGWGAKLLRTRPLRPLTATHPDVAQRVAALEALELRLHAARVRPDLLPERP